MANDAVFNIVSVGSEYWFVAPLDADDHRTGRPLFSKPSGICHRHGVSVGSEDWLVAPLDADAHRSSFVWQTLRYLL